MKRELLQNPYRESGGLSATSVVRHQSIGDALWNEHGAVVGFLLEQKGIESHLRYTDVMGNTVFHKATRGRDKESLELLISRFPEAINQKKNIGDTLLHMLDFNGNAELAKLLLELGHADVRCGSTEQPSS